MRNSAVLASWVARLLCVISFVFVSLQIMAGVKDMIRPPHPNEIMMGIPFLVAYVGYGVTIWSGYRGSLMVLSGLGLFLVVNLVTSKIPPMLIVVLLIMAVPAILALSVHFASAREP